MGRSLLLALAIVALGCDFKVPLPHGYEIWQLEGRDTRVVTPNHYTAVAPDVRSYAVIGDVVVGYATLPRPPAPREPEPPVVRTAPGYFILDTASGRVWDPLTKEQWLARLRKLGVANEPSLRAL